MALADKVTQFNTDADLAHQIIHGPASGTGSTVTTEGGEVRSFAKLEADLSTGVSGSASAAAASATAAANSATAAAASAAAANAVVTGVSVVRHSLRPSLLLAFSLMGGKMDPRVVVSRPSAGGRFNARGLYESVAANRPRFDFDPVTQKPLGLLVEEQRTNLMLYPRNFENAAWLKNSITVTPNAGIAPDGTRTAALLTATGVDGHLPQNISGAVAGNTYTGSVWLRADAATTINIYVTNTGVGGNTLKTCNVTATWQRFDVTHTVAAGATGVSLQIGGANSFSTGEAVYAWHGQLEQGAFATSAIPDPTTFTSRASGNASYIGSNGLLQYAGSNVGRIQYNALDLTVPGKLLLEAAGTNLLTYSERFDNAAWGKTDSSITGVLFTAPDGSLSASKLTENTATLPHFVASPTVTVAAGTYTSSVYVKAGERTKCVIHHRDSAAANYAAATFDLVAGTVSAAATVVGTSLSAASARIEYLNNGWYRCSVTATLDGSFTGLRLWVRLHNDTNDTYTGNGTSGLYIWGAQVEAGAYATSYTPSTDTFTSRASAGSYNGSNGLVQSAASNVARMQYNPLNLAAPAKLLLEAAATNLLLRSEEVDNAAWTKLRTTVSANAAAAPDGNSTADKLTEDTTASNTHVAFNDVVISTQQKYTFSVFAKAAGRTQLSLNQFLTGVTAGANFDLSAGTATATGAGTNATITNMGNGWYRCAFTFDLSAATFTTIRAEVRLMSGGAESYTGDGTSGIYLWGGQVEAGSFATSYIATTSAQVTRAADVSSSAQTTRAADVSSSAQATRSADAVSMPTSAAWFNQNEGTLYVEAGTNGLGTSNKYPWLSRLDDGSNDNKIGFWINDPSGDFVAAQIKNTGILQLDTTSAAVATVGTPIKAVLGYKTNDSAFSINGGAATVDTACTIPVINRLFIGNGDYPLNGYVKRIAYYPRRLSNAELQGLTQ